mgnify:CR=1 FL=1
MKTAQITWHQQTPYSTEFNDIYFSAEDGLAESQYVFLQANHLPERWQQQSQLTICELGFGSGLNFLLTWQQWQQAAPQNSHLHYLAIEKFPLTANTLSTLYDQWPTLACYSNQLLDHYPPTTSGFHQLQIAPNLTLTLIFDDIATALTQITDKIDIWYLDGFALQKNPDMWTDTVFSHMHRLSQTGTTLSTFTAAGQVRRGLVNTGFAIQKQKGFGKKREMLVGQYRADSKTNMRYAKANIKPWFARPKTSRQTEQSVIIIGAGLAGCACANQLAQAGFTVTLIDPHPTVAQQASGNRQGILKPYLTLNNSLLDQFYTTGFLHSRHAIDELAQQDFDLRLDQCGAIELHPTEWLTRLAKRQLPSSLAQIIDATQASQISGCAISNHGLYLPTALTLSPQKFCQALVAEHTDRIDYQMHQITQFAFDQSRWHLLTQTGATLKAAYVIVAAGAESDQWQQTQNYPIQSCPGQVTLLPTCDALQSLNCILCADSYCLPELNGTHLIGATYRQPGDSTRMTPEDHQFNIDQLKQMLPGVIGQVDINTLTGRVSTRANTPDHLPLVGPIANHKTLQQQYAKLTEGGTLSRCHYPIAEYYPNLYLCSGFGSRGLASCLLSAKVMRALITQTALPISRSLYEALHPSRFWVRQLVRGCMPGVSTRN